jgi:hypothetical protein
MTLILSLLTPHHVIQVSDRRLVWLRSGGAVRHDDEKNKAVLFCGRLSFAFTGLAELGREERRTDLWLAGVLAEFVRQAETGVLQHGQEAALGFIAARATEEFRRPLIRRLSTGLKRHAFVGVGWARFEGEQFAPYLNYISNFHSEDGQALGCARDSFTVHVRALAPSEGGYLLDLGQELGEGEKEALTRELATTQREGGGSEPMVELLAEKVREVGSRNRLVGRGLLATVLPRASVKAGSTEVFALSGPPMPEHQTFLYVPPDEDQGVSYGPTFTCGGAVMSDFKVTSA